MNQVLSTLGGYGVDLSMKLTLSQFYDQNEMYENYFSKIILEAAVPC